jgi:multiple sugar transport system ATP-binding protein
MEGPVAPDGVHLGDYVVPVPRDVLSKAGDEKELVLGIRPETFELANAGEAGIGIDVGVVEELGADAFVYGTLTGLPEDQLITAKQITARIHGRTPPHRGETVRLQIEPTHVHVFSKRTGERISTDQQR